MPLWLYWILLGLLAGTLAKFLFRDAIPPAASSRFCSVSSARSSAA
jgi:hypothetical protein